MKQQDFINKMLGVGWVNRASSFDAVDCYGLVMLYYKHVLDIDLDKPKGYQDNVCIADCWSSETKSNHWIEVDKPLKNGVVFTSYKGNNPSHVGLFIGDGKVLHCQGDDEHGGSVAVHSIKAMQRLNSKMTYHIHEALL